MQLHSLPQTCLELTNNNNNKNLKRESNKECFVLLIRKQSWLLYDPSANICFIITQYPSKQLGSKYYFQNIFWQHSVFAIQAQLLRSTSYVHCNQFLHITILNRLACKIKPKVSHHIAKRWNVKKRPISVFNIYNMDGDLNNMYMIQVQHGNIKYKTKMLICSSLKINTYREIKLKKK